MFAANKKKKKSQNKIKTMPYTLCTYYQYTYNTFAFYRCLHPKQLTFVNDQLVSPKAN